MFFTKFDEMLEECDKWDEEDTMSSNVINKQEDKLDLVISKLDKIIELLTPKEVMVNSLYVTSSNEHSLQAKDKRPLVIERNKDGRLRREGRLNSDGSVEWTKNYR